jgi:putative aminopeptidase FrvX
MDMESLKELVMLPGVTGHEDAVRAYLKRRVGKRADVTIDRMGNLIATLGDGEPTTAVVAHMDEVGMLVANIMGDGTLTMKKMGGIDDRVLPGRMVVVHTKRGEVNGVIGIKAPHLTIDKDEATKVTPWQRLAVDLGTRSEKETAALGVEHLDAITIKKGWQVMNKDYLCSRALDNRVGCWAVLQAFEAAAKRPPKGTVSYVWSVQEEGGLRGAAVIGNTMYLDYVLAIDTYSTSDAPGLDKFFKPVLLGKGPVLRAVDAVAVATPSLREAIKRTAKAAKIPLQVGVTGGTTDGAKLQESGAATVPLGVPMRYTHSPAEVVHIRDVENLARLIPSVLTMIGQKRP